MRGSAGSLPVCLAACPLLWLNLSLVALLSCARARRESAEAVVAAMGGGATLEGTTRLVEELSRLH